MTTHAKPQTNDGVTTTAKAKPTQKVDKITPDNDVVDNSLAAQAQAPDDHKLAAQDKHVTAVLDALDDLIDRVGKDIAQGIDHENRAVRVGANDLKVTLDALQTARAVVAGFTPGQVSGVRTSRGVAS